MEISQQLWMRQPQATKLRDDVDTLAKSMNKYACRLNEQNATVSLNHSRHLPVYSPASDHEYLELLSPV
jgi:hypothetical protein